MNVTDLVEVLRFIERGIGNLPSSYAQIAAAMNQASTLRQSAQAAQQAAQLQNLSAQVNATRNAVLESLGRSDPPSDWPEAKRRAFDALGAREVLGKEARATFDSAFANGVVDAASVGQAMQRMQNAAQGLAAKVTNILPTLANMAPERSAPPPQTGSAVVILSFGDGIPIESLADLAKASNEWDNTIKTFAEVTHAPHESPKLLDLQKGSLDVYVLAAMTTATALATTVTAIMQAVDKALTLKKTANELRQSGAVRESVPKEVEDAADKQIGESVAKAVGALIEDNKWNPASGDTNELRNRVRLSADRVAMFVINGGVINLRLPPAQPDAGQPGADLERLDNARKELAAIMQKVDRIAAEVGGIKQLPVKSQAEDDDAAHAAKRGGAS